MISVLGKSVLDRESTPYLLLLLLYFLLLCFLLLYFLLKMLLLLILPIAVEKGTVLTVRCL